MSVVDLVTGRRGLTAAEAARRLAGEGPNALPVQRRMPAWRLLAAEMVHFFALLFWVAGGLAFLAGMPQLGVAVFVVVVLNALFWQIPLRDNRLLIGAVVAELAMLAAFLYIPPSRTCSASRRRPPPAFSPPHSPPPRSSPQTLSISESPALVSKQRGPNDPLRVIIDGATERSLRGRRAQSQTARRPLHHRHCHGQLEFGPRHHHNPTNRDVNR